MAINTSILKSYAPEARRTFIAAVKTRAARFGIVDGGSATIQEQGEVAVINGQAYPRTVARQCRDLEGKIRLRGFDAVMEEVAYTWFNRFAAIRYMELHGYLDHGFRVLSHPTGEARPEIIQHAEKVELPGLRADRVVDLKLDGRKDEDLYRMLLVAQCNALHAAMPFLFERIDDETELLLPDNLLHSDSVIRQMVDRIPEGDWEEIEIIGWLYQFYISEKKDQVIGKVVKPEDIPAATQLFTPNWIVKYMVQNSLGAKWLATYPDSPIRAKLGYYFGPAEQSEEVHRQIEVETPNTLDPEKLTFLDPATGSGHILVEAYGLFKEIYLERGYRLRDIPRLILEKNIYGLDIDDRAAQLAGFALMMCARADDRSILSGERVVRLNVVAVQESTESIAARSAEDLRLQTGTAALDPSFLSELVGLFSSAKAYGSLLRIPSQLAARLPEAEVAIAKLRGSDLLSLATQGALVSQLAPLVRQSEILAQRFDVVVANPPYMGAKYHTPQIKAFARTHFSDARSDTYAMFLRRATELTKPDGVFSMITMETWLFQSGYDQLREELLKNRTLLNVVHMPYSGRSPTPMGISFGTTISVVRNNRVAGYRSGFTCVHNTDLTPDGVAVPSKLSPDNSVDRVAEEFHFIPGSPIIYGLASSVLTLFRDGVLLGSLGETASGLQTSDNDRFIRYWHEVSANRIGFDSGSRAAAQESGKRWFPHVKGGAFRKWYGNTDFVINWEDDGRELFKFATDLYGSPTRILKNTDKYFVQGVYWSHTTSAHFSARLLPTGTIFNVESPAIFSDDNLLMLSILSTRPVVKLLEEMNPSFHFVSGSVANVPINWAALTDVKDALRANGAAALEIARADWDASEGSSGFQSLPLLDGVGGTVSDSVDRWSLRCIARFEEMRRLEETNNRIFIESQGLTKDFGPAVPDEEITLVLPDTYRACIDYISYFVGCVVGRYSLNEPGLILANQGGTVDDFLARISTPTFIPDADNIIPMLDDNWFEDDVTDRFFEFLKVTFGTEYFDENLAFIEKAIGKDIRKFVKRDFFSDHLKRYKRRPIYWVFSSGKEKAFEAIVYMHRYNETTLARMRMNYVVPLQSQMASRIERLATELSGVNLSSAERKRKDTQRAKLIKQLEELGRFEEELRHLADQRIRIDLDDGVKVNYGKFGNLLAEVKAVTGGGDE